MKIKLIKSCQIYGKGLLNIFMRTFIFLFCATVFSLTPNDIVSQNSKIIIEEDKSLAVDDVFRLISTQTDYNFFYESGMFKGFPRINVKKGVVRTNKLLRQSLSSGDFEITLTNDYDIIIKKKEPKELIIKQGIKVSGTVTDQTGQPLPGANILEKGTSNGTQSDFDGNFSIDVNSENATLVVSYLGYESQEVVLNGESTISISLVEDSGLLDEIVVTGYSTQSRAKVTTAVSQIKGDDLVKSTNLNLGSSLTGQMPGLIVTSPIGEPGNDSPSILIRGLSTITGANSPLIVIDGVANADGINRLDPNDIDTFTVLKDASAAIYGAQSAAGVILITTKRGKKGDAKFDFSSSYGFVSPIGVPEYSDAALQLKGLGFADDIIQPWLDGTNESTDWLDEVLKNSSGQQRHSLTASGGSDKISYFASLGYSTQEGQITGDDKSGNDQYNIRTNIDAQLNDKLKLGLNFSGRRQDRVLLSRSLQDNIRNSGLSTPLQPAYVQGQPSFGRLGQSALSVAKAEGDRRVSLDVLNATLKLEYDLSFLEGLSFETWGNIVTNQQFEKDYFVPYTYYEEDAEGNLISQTSSNGGGRISLREEFLRSTSLTYNARLKYKQSFGDHNINAFLAYEQNTFKTNNTQAQRLEFDSPAVPELFAGTTNPDLIRNTGRSNEGARQNYFGQVTYDYKGKYLFQAHLRRDASERFAEPERVGYFPGISGGWVVSKEDFFKVPAIDHLKIRGSWGILGNDAIGRFNYLSLFNFSTGYVFNGSLVVGGNAEGTLAAPNTTWEKKETHNLGFELGLFNKKLSLEFDYFKYNTSDILITRNATVTDVSGIGSKLPTENLGEFENKGFEILATYRGNIGDFNYTISGNLTSTRNKTIFIDEPEMAAGREHLSREGKPWATPLMYIVEGRFLTQADIDDPNKLGLGSVQLGDWIYRDVNEDGVINATDRVIADHNSTPQVIAGLNINANYKGLDLTVNAFANARVRKFIDNYISGEINNTAAYYFNNIYYGEDEPGTIPARNRGIRQPNTFWEKDASFVRIRSIELGYSLPKNIISQIGLSRVRFYVNGNNLFTFSKFKDYKLGDPETFVSGSFHYQPSFSTITTGVNVSF